MKFFSRYSNRRNSVPMKKYMRNQFEFLGIKSPQMKELSRRFFAKHWLPDYTELNRIVKELWGLPEREYQYLALGIVYKLRKFWKPKEIKLIEWMVAHKSWWDTVDYIASKLAGSYFLFYSGSVRTITRKWADSSNFWFNRTAIIFQLGYKDKTNTGLLFQYIRKHSSQNEFFIRKAIGWALREYSRTSPGAVKDFVRNHPLKPLSVKEALRRIEP